MYIKFNDYNQQQNWLFPPYIEELIPEGHPVRIVNRIIEQLDLRLLIKEYCKDGKPSYHPKMMALGKAGGRSQYQSTKTHKIST